MAPSYKDDGDIAEELRETLDRATLGHLTRILKDDKDWARVRDVNDRFAERRETLTRDFGSDYDRRFAEARSRLLAEAAKPRLDHPAPPGLAARTELGITAAAHRAVARDHLEDQQAAIEERRVALDALVAEVRARESPQSEVRTSFERASEPPSAGTPPGPGPTRSRD